MIEVATLLAQLSHVKPTGKDQWSANCPAHEDRNPSLSIRATADKILLHCFAGCSVNEICDALEIKLIELFADDQGAAGTAGKEIVETYDYVDAKGQLIYQVVRFRPKGFAQRRPDGLGGWAWKLGNIKRVLYRLPRVTEAIARGEPVYLLEGEKDVAKAEGIGLVATTNAGGANKWNKRYTKALEGARVVIIPDNDAPGLKHAEARGADLAGVATSIKVVHLPGLPEKADLADWLDGGHTAEELLALVDQTDEWQPKRDAAALYRLTDAGNAERFAAQHGPTIRYVADSAAWHFWTGVMWGKDMLGEITRRGIATVRAIQDEALLVEDVEQRGVWLKWASRSESMERLRAMVSLGKDQSGVSIRQSDLDPDPYALNVLNGTIDLRSGQLREHDPHQLCSKLAPVEYHPEAKAPRWERFLAEIFDRHTSLIDYVQKVAGYALTGSTKEQEVYFLVGKGANGKGVFVEAVRNTIGDYAADTPFNTFLERRSEATNDLAALVGARLVTASEGSAGQAFNEGLLKRLAGGDLISCRFLHREFFSYLPRFKVLFSTNELPRLSGQTYAMRRRVRVIPFRQTFYQPWEAREPVREEGLIDVLMGEREGILAWAVQGCLQWREEGLSPPEEVLDETTSIMQQMDALADFLVDCCVVHPRVDTATDNLWREYREWCRANMLKELFRSKGGFTRNVASRPGISLYRRADGSYLNGIGIRDQVQEGLNLDSGEEAPDVASEAQNGNEADAAWDE